MAQRKEWRTLPNGQRTTNVEEYLRAWKRPAEILKKHLGWHLHGFGRGYLFRPAESHRMLDLPTGVVQLLCEKLRDLPDPQEYGTIDGEQGRLLFCTFDGERTAYITDDGAIALYRRNDGVLEYLFVSTAPDPRAMHLWLTYGLMPFREP